MKEIKSDKIINIVKEMCIEANLELPCDVKQKIKEKSKEESNDLAKKIFKIMDENQKFAYENKIPICQDTGMVDVFLEYGQDIHIEGSLEDAINEGVRRGYKEGYLRKSIVCDPLMRKNTNDNTPAFIYTKIVKGDKLKITIAPKGAGSENMSKLKMMNPQSTQEDIIEFVVGVVKEAGGKACPPLVVGVGIGGNFSYCPYLAKYALTRDINIRNKDENYKKLEDEILNRLNQTNIGPQGLGGNITALGVNIETYPTHIASLPVAVSLSCHVTRHITKEL